MIIYILILALHNSDPDVLIENMLATLQEPAYTDPHFDYSICRLRPARL